MSVILSHLSFVWLTTPSMSSPCSWKEVPPSGVLPSQPITRPEQLEPYLDTLQGTRLMCVGGVSSKPEQIETYKVWLMPESITWVESHKGTEVQRIQSAAQKIRAGSVDVVLLFIRVLGHHKSRLILDACKQTDASVKYAVIREGFGVNGLA